MIYLKYLSYLLRHKWYVFVECCKVGMPVRGLMHDMSKFRPSEFIPYARWFFGKHGVRFMKDEIDDYTYWMDDMHHKVREGFDFAWLLHQKRNPHHWQYWILNKESGDVRVFDMPSDVRMEMVCDWRGAGKAQGHGDDTKGWYIKNREKMKLGHYTRKWIEGQLSCDDLLRG